MHGREGEYRKQSRQMRSVPARGTTGTTRAVVSASSTTDCFFKDGRKICVGDSALFKPPQDSPPFIGIIRWLSSNKEDNLQLGVNWLYRPIELKLGKGILLDAAPNEVFYSFHKDEIPAASLLHPCKVAFLPKGIELPSGTSSFVCRRVYDIESRCLWWLTDQDYIDERQEEVDQLLYKTQIEMHATVQSGGRSPKPINGSTSMPQSKSGSDNVQNVSSIPSQAKGRKRERADQGSEPVKRERSLKADDGDSVQFRSESILRLEISRITEKGGLVDAEGVEKLAQLMQPNRVERKLELVSRSIFAGVIAATENFDCLTRFVQLKGLSVLDEWLQDVHKGKVGDGSPKDGDKSVEEFLLILLRALDKLPVNLQALQMCNIGKSVNHLRTYKNSEIQKKARSLVDTWKKRVEAEMNVIDSKSGSNQAVSWPSRSRLAEGSHGGIRHSGGPSEVAMKSSAQLSAAKIASSKPVQGEMSAKFTSSSPGPTKVVPSSASGKDGQPRSIAGSNPDLPSNTARDERSSSSSQSHNNSQSCSSDHAKTTGFSGKEDARSSTAGSISVNKVAGGSSRHRRSVNGYPAAGLSGSPRETGSSRNAPLHRNLASEKLCQSGLTCEKALDLPTIEGSSHKLIVKIPNRGRNPAQSASVGLADDSTVMHSRASSPVLPEKPDQSDHNSKEKADVNRANTTPDMKTESWPCNDFKDILTGSDEGDGSPDAILEGRCRNGDDATKSVEISKAVSLSSGNELVMGKLHDASFSSMNALIESCIKYSQANTSLSIGDDVGMNLLASVAAGEMSKSDLASPDGSSGRTTHIRDDCGMGDDAKSKASFGNNLAREQSQSDDGLHLLPKQASGHFCGDGKPTSISIQTGEDDSHDSKVDSKTAGKSWLENNEKSDEFRDAATVSASASGTAEKVLDSEESKQLDEKAGIVTGSGVTKIEAAILKESSSLIDDKGNDGASSLEVRKEAAEGLLSYETLYTDSENKADVREACNGGSYSENKPLSENKSDVRKACNDSGKYLHSESVDELNDVKLEEMEIESQVGKQSIGQGTKNVPFNDAQVLSGLGSKVGDQKSEGMEANTDFKGVVCGGEESQKVLPEVPSQNVEQRTRPRGSRVTCDDANESTESESSAADAASFPAAETSDFDTKLKFDLNEGFIGDDGKLGESINLEDHGCPVSAHVVNPLPFTVASISNGLPASITVAAAAKGPFVPPVDLLRSKGELGWKGSAATSAFRPAEPRKAPEMPPCAANTPDDAGASKHARPMLDFDLNVPDERIIEDLASRNSAQEIASSSAYATSHDLAQNKSLVSPPLRCSVGLDLDLNRVDEAGDVGQCSASSSRGLEVPILPAKSSSLGGYPNCESRRDFDLNNGPVLDEVVEPSLLNPHSRSNMRSQPFLAGLRMSNEEAGTFSSWFPTGNAFPPVSIPSFLSDRGDQPFPIVAGGGPARMLGPPTGTIPFGPDLYRGSVLSSSPAVPFPSPPFQYSVFPFGTGFPLPSASLSGGSTTYIDSSSSGRLAFPAINSQLSGPSAAITSQYPRPYVVSLPDGSNNIGVGNNSKWGRQGLDLNAGPGSLDMEGRDESSPFALRQLSVASSQALSEEQGRMFQQVAGGVLKRKENDGGMNAENFRYKQPSWQ